MQFTTTIHFHTKEGEELNLGRASKEIAEIFEASTIPSHLILTDKCKVGRRVILPIRSYYKIKDNLSSKKENLIFGLEFDNPHYHLLGLCMDPSEWEDKICPTELEDICQRIEGSGGIIAVPHICGACGIGEDGLLRILDLYKNKDINHKPLIEISFYIESFPSFSRGLRRLNIEAIELARKYDLGIFAGLDTRFSRLDLAYNVSKEHPYIALKKATYCFDNGSLIPYIIPSHVPLGRENLYLIRDNGIGLLTQRRSPLLESFIKKMAF
ncbi:MAG: hypothetical protein QMD12_02920 [Candidatus Aenigmarchaeota archaeon]|nr:hypothetical protein [Candidatus Aenigmarchaeota archaeon]